MSNGPRVSQGERLPSVLVVEDDFMVRAVAVAHLEESGFSIVEAQTADEAMVILRDDRSIAAVFSDVQMPGSMDGIALAQWLARTCPKVKVPLPREGWTRTNHWDGALSQSPIRWRKWSGSCAISSSLVRKARTALNSPATRNSTDRRISCVELRVWASLHTRRQANGRCGRTFR
jgi:Response regulator receiver domain